MMRETSRNHFMLIHLGLYEITDSENLMRQEILSEESNKDFHLKPNNNTFQSEKPITRLLKIIDIKYVPYIRTCR